MMTGGTERLKVVSIPEQFVIPIMFHNVVNLELVMNHPTGCAGISTFHQHPFPLTLPTVPVIQSPYHPVGALLFLHARMGGAASTLDELPTPGLRTEHHAYLGSGVGGND
jgi:hypothetical protein